MTILAIDTSTPCGSVAVLRDGELLLSEIFVADRSHSSSLFAVLERARALVESLDQVAIGLGPGSYAGVRISIAAGIALELALGATLLGLSSVAALETVKRSYLAIGDARRETYYFTQVEDGECVEGPLLLTAAELRARLSAETRPVFATAEMPGFDGVRIALPSALKLAQLATQNRGVIARADLEPIYLREPHITQPKPR